MIVISQAGFTISLCIQVQNLRIAHNFVALSVACLGGAIGGQTLEPQRFLHFNSVSAHVWCKNRLSSSPKQGHRVVEEAGRPAPILAWLLNAGVLGEICLISMKICNFVIAAASRPWF
jgi:hypothetical protein